MKIFLSLIILFFASCNANKNLSFVVKNPIQVNAKNCAPNGKCELSLTPNKSLIFKTDKFGNLYPEISEGENTLLTYTFKRNPIKNTQDSNYTEIIYATLPKNIKEISLANSELKQVNLHFARLCFCKGETGYYPIGNGTFKLTKTSKDSIKITCEFKVKNIPQVVSSFEETVSLESN
jgi:hypothetical protein